MKRRDHEVLLLRKKIEKSKIENQLDSNNLPKNKHIRTEKRLKKLEEEIVRHKEIIKKLQEKKSKKEEKQE